MVMLPSRGNQCPHSYSRRGKGTEWERDHSLAGSTDLSTHSQSPKHSSHRQTCFHLFILTYKPITDVYLYTAGQHTILLSTSFAGANNSTVPVFLTLYVLIRFANFFFNIYFATHSLETLTGICILKDMSPDVREHTYVINQVPHKGFRSHMFPGSAART